MRSLCHCFCLLLLLLADWGDIDEALPEQFISGTASYQDLLVNIGPNASGTFDIRAASIVITSQ